MSFWEIAGAVAHLVGLLASASLATLWLVVFVVALRNERRDGRGRP